MADPLDLAKAGEVQQNALGQGAQGLQQGASLAMAYQQHQQAMQDHQAKMAQFQEQQAQWANEQIGTISGIQNPQLRTQRFKQFQKTAQVAGVQVDPGWESLLKNDDTAMKIGQAQAQLHGLPYNQKVAAWQDNMRMLGDAATGEKALTDTGQITQQRYATNIGAQVQGVQLQREMGYHQMEQASKDYSAVSAQNKDQYDALRSANFINQTLMSKNPGPIEIADAKGVVDKIINQGAVLRPQTMTLLGDSPQGLVNDAKALLSQLSGKGKITDSQRKQLLEITNRFSKPMQDTLLAQKNEYEKTFPGVNSNYVFGGMQELQDFGQPGSPSVVAQQKVGSTQTAQNAQAPSTQQSGSGAFAQLAPTVQNAAVARAAQLGITLDPKSPQFSQQLAAFTLALKQKVGSVAQAAPPAQAAPAPGAGQ